MVEKSAPLDLPTFKRSAKSSGAAANVTPPSARGRQARSVSLPTTTVKQPEPAALPFLPKAKRPNFSSHRNDANAALALDLLADVEGAITEWHQSLRQILLDIQALYRTGPIIEGWLEAIPKLGSTTSHCEDSSVLRHGDAEQIAAYVEKLSQAPQTETTSGTTQYQLCNLDADGQVQCQICPPEQLGVISQAIARHQQLRQLVNQKQYLEARLKGAAEALETTRKTLGLTE